MTLLWAGVGIENDLGLRHQQPQWYIIKDEILLSFGWMKTKFKHNIIHRSINFSMSGFTIKTCLL